MRKTQAARILCCSLFIKFISKFGFLGAISTRGYYRGRGRGVFTRRPYSAYAAKILRGSKILKMFIDGYPPPSWVKIFPLTDLLFHFDYSIIIYIRGLPFFPCAYLGSKILNTPPLGGGRVKYRGPKYLSNARVRFSLFPSLIANLVTDIKIVWVLLVEKILITHNMVQTGRVTLVNNHYDLHFSQEF